LSPRSVSAEDVSCGHQRREERGAIKAAGGLDPDVVEAACLAHDLGHPPFGHLGEQELNKRVQRLGLFDGFEGNAQTLRIVCRLGAASTGESGLNLSRATLNAILKYPWRRQTGDRKWGAYETEAGIFEWARESLNLADKQRTLEASIMDWADDITYGVHDVEDFYQVGFIPLPQLTALTPAQFPHVDLVRRRWERKGLEPFDQQSFERAVRATVHWFPLDSEWTGTRSQRVFLRSYTSNAIGRYVGNTRIRRGLLQVPRQYRLEVEVLQSLTWAYVVESSALTTQQFGERRIISELFDIYWKAILGGAFGIFPPRLQEEVEQVATGNLQLLEAVRFVADTIASMTEREATNVHRRLTGVALGSVSDSAI
jgi:dGTPase